MSYRLPNLQYPFPSDVSRFAADVDEECYRWGEKMGIYHLGDPADYRSIQVGWLAAYTCPRGTREGLQLLADWQMWLFAFDDGFCDESEHGRRPDAMVRRVTEFLGILEGACPASEDPFDQGLADVTGRLADRAEGFQQARFVAAVRGYFMAQCWEAANRAAGSVPSFPEYAYMRRHSGAVRTCTAISDVAGGFALSAREYDHPDVVAATDAAINIACWANDILSYPKETRRSQVVHSLPVVLGAEQGMAKAAKAHDSEVTRYLDKEQRIRGWAGPQLQRYLDDLRFWITGNLAWSKNSGRYQNQESA